MLPNFIIAGASKSGSEWLMRCIGEHPDALMLQRSAEFFSYRYEKGLGWYESLFDAYGGQAAVGEKSTSYIIYPDVPERMWECVPGVRLLFVLREPISRAVSHYRMLLRAGQVSDRIEDELVPNSPLVEEGRYTTRLDRFLEFFPSQQVELLLYDDLKTDPEGFVRDAFNRLGVDSSFTPSLLNARFHATKSRPRFQRVYNAAVSAANRAQQTRVGRSAVEVLRRRGYVDLFHRVNRGPDFPEMGRDHEQMLADYYAKDIEELSRRLGRDLVSAWLSPRLQ